MSEIELQLRKEFNRFTDRTLSGDSVLIVTHNFPDPDGLAASMGLQRFFRHNKIEKCTISFYGFIGRAENREMINQLNIEYEPLDSVKIEEYERIIIVDTLPKNGNISIDEDTKVDVILDHHGDNKSIPDNQALNLCYSNIGATSTIVYYLLRIAGTPIDKYLATALFYGIKTDTMDMARNYCQDDIIAYKDLFDIMDHELLSKIENPKREPQYLQFMHRGLEDFCTYNNFGYTHIGKVPLPDYIPEMADMFHKLDNLEWIVCSGFFGNNLLFSIRSISDKKAGIYAHKLATIFNGSGGGHTTMAAGRIPAKEMGADRLLESFSQAMFAIFNVNPEDKTRVLDMKTGITIQ